MTSNLPTLPNWNSHAAQAGASRWHSLVDHLFEIVLILLILIGIGYRFSRVNWSQGANLHPDEYGLTSTLTQLSLPKDLAGYFNTRISPLSPYIKYDAAGQKISDGPDNRLRWGQWPIILLRAAAELTGNTGYDDLRLMGRQLSAVADVISLAFLYLIGSLLYNRKTGLLAAALSALAVLQIQQSHFMTVDNFAVMFAVLAMYAAVRIARQPLVVRAPVPSGSSLESYRTDWKALTWYLLFGMFFGMAVASKVNLLPLGGMVGVAAFISVADLKLKNRADLERIVSAAAGFLVLTVLAALLTFRLTQPMAFRAVTGDTTLLTLQPNPDWIESMKVAQMESDGIGGGPPGEQWVGRTVILFPLVNMVLWGMGLPLGAAAWGGWLAAFWQWLRYGRGWRAHLLPLVWVGGDFFFLATRWVKSVRYFLPIYPFLCLLAAWGLLALWQRFEKAPLLRRAAPAALLALVTLGTLAWATSFMSAIYWTDHTRLQATEWILQNVPAPINLTLRSPDGQSVNVPVSAPDQLSLGGQVYIQSFTPRDGGSLMSVEIPHVAAQGGEGQLNIALMADPDGKLILDQADLEVRAAVSGGTDSPAQAELRYVALESGVTYYLRVTAPIGQPQVVLSRSVISNESWDEGLPVPFEGYDPFGQFYRGLTMEVRWMDDENKRAMFIDTINQADYIIVPSQRAVWASCRLPRMYPMTMAYYSALFDGRLGFDKVAEFSAPWRLGSLYISDLAGSAAWGQPPALPVFNHNPLAAEEAFSVYDHPPVWIFHKRPDFNPDTVLGVLYSIDLGQVLIQSPRTATGAPCQ
jgi:4-amino-4-deoxy-L-arabinose transferase-like glycosyltransferase